MMLRSCIRIGGFALIIVGTAGLLFNEFVGEGSSTRTIVFGVVNFVGLVNAQWGMGESKG